MEISDLLMLSKNGSVASVFFNSKSIYSIIMRVVPQSVIDQD